MRGFRRLIGLAAVLVVAVPAVSTAADSDPGWWLRSRTTAYVFQTEDDVGVDEDRFGFYQHLGGAVTGLAGGKVDFRFSGRATDDLALDEKITDRARLYTAYVDARFSPRFSARVGRQFIHRSSFSMTIDGGLLTFRPDLKWTAEVWGGVRSPLITSYRNRTGDMGEDLALGARVTMRPDRRAKLGISIASRENDGETAETPIGFEATVRPCRHVSIAGHTAYDIEQEVSMRNEVHGRWHHARRWPSLTIQWVDRRPRVDATSYFKRFDDVERIQVFRSVGRWEHRNGFGGEVEAFGAVVDERSSTRLGAALVSPFGRVGYSTRFGDTGEENRWYGDVGVSATEWLRLEGGASISAYAMIEDAPENLERDLVSAYGRLRVDVTPGADLIMEIQTMENPVYEEDVRFLAGLDLTAAGGTAWSALGSGGWLR